MTDTDKLYNTLLKTCTYTSTHKSNIDPIIRRNNPGYSLHLLNWKEFEYKNTLQIEIMVLKAHCSI